MDFELSKSQKEIQKAAGGFAKGEFDKKLALELDRKHEFPCAIWQKAAGLGFICLHFPEEYAGQGLGVLENIPVAEEFCRRDSGIALILANFASEGVLCFGSDKLKEKFMPPVVEGKMLSAGAFTEPEHGSNITFMDTTAVKDGMNEIGLPCVLSIQTGINEPRYVGIRGIRKVASIEILIHGAGDSVFL